MMGQPAAQRISVEEYLAAEEVSEVRHEFFDGQVFAMAGASADHNLLVAEILRLLNNRFADSGSGCDAIASDMQVRTPDGLYTYPDVVVACEDREFVDERERLLLNPRVVFEILSPSTQAYDLTTKCRKYQAIPSLTDYIAVWQDTIQARHHRRLAQPLREGGPDWIAEDYDGEDAVLQFDSLGLSLRLGDLYRRLTLPEPSPLRPPVDDGPDPLRF